MSEYIFENIKLNIGDYSEYIKSLDDNSINMIYLDPPFNSNRNYKLNEDSDIGFEDKWSDEKYKSFLKELIDSLYPLLKLNG
ncbi:uncharacterized protein METZ01_LOCUS502388, partial [marine metagenome]